VEVHRQLVERGEVDEDRHARPATGAGAHRNVVGRARVAQAFGVHVERGAAAARRLSTLEHVSGQIHAGAVENL
jgi:hypothetical protein